MKDRWFVLLMEEFHISLVNHLWHISPNKQVQHIQSCRNSKNDQEHICSNYLARSALLTYLKEGMKKLTF